MYVSLRANYKLIPAHNPISYEQNVSEFRK